jgi:hypothetical protein
MSDPYQGYYATVTITNCTFTNAGYQWIGQNGWNWDGTFLFQKNTFSSSVGTTVGSTPCSVYFYFDAPVTSGSRTIDQCVFDKTVMWANPRQVTMTNNVILGNVFHANPGNWPTQANWSNNFVQFNETTIGGPNIYGPIQNCYFYDLNSTNPHYVGFGDGVTNGVVQNCIFEAGPANDGAGDVIFPSSNSSGTLKVIGNIVLPANGKTSGLLVSNLQSGSSVAITVEHNTFHATLGEAGLVHLDETTNSYVGEIASCRANLVWSATGGQSYCLAVIDYGSGTSVTDSVTVAGYNWFQNPTTGTCTLNGVSTSTVGYSGLKCSTAGFPSSQLGTSDQTGDPQFIDSTRNLASWGGTAAGGGVATVAGAINALKANPSLIGQATTGLLAWIRAGFVVQNAALKTGSYALDPSTADASGKPWPGSPPGIGAMALFTSVTSYTLIGPITGGQNVASTSFSVQPSGLVTDTITFSDGGAGGTFAPTSLSWSSSGAALPFTYTPKSAGAITITLTSGASYSVTGSPTIYTSVSAVFGPLNYTFQGGITDQIF